jgi:hypothetical protein
MLSGDEEAEAKDGNHAFPAIERGRLIWKLNRSDDDRLGVSVAFVGLLRHPCLLMGRTAGCCWNIKSSSSSRTVVIGLWYTTAGSCSSISEITSLSGQWNANDGLSGWVWTCGLGRVWYFRLGIE